MAAEQLKLSLQATLVDVNGQQYQSASLVMQFLSQTKAGLREFTIPHGGTPVDLWDPTTWAGFPEAAFRGALFAIQDIGVAVPSASVVPVELEVVCNLANAQGLIITIPAAGFFILPSRLSYRTPTQQNDQWTGSTAGVINRLRAKNSSVSTDVKLSMWMADDTAP